MGGARGLGAGCPGPERLFLLLTGRGDGPSAEAAVAADRPTTGRPEDVCIHSGTAVAAAAAAAYPRGHRGDMPTGHAPPYWLHTLSHTQSHPLWSVGTV